MFVSATPNGPHLYTRQLTIVHHDLEKEYYQSPKYPTDFFRHFRLFCNLQDLTIKCAKRRQEADDICGPHVFSHLFATLRSLSIHRARCSPQALISLIASFQQLERLRLHGIWFHTPNVPLPLPEKHTFKGKLFFTDWEDSSEGFVGMLAQYDLQYREAFVNGERWLQDTAWNRCLAKFSDHLEGFGIYWSEDDGESACWWSNGIVLFTPSSRRPGAPV
jgi:hypothetical protein